MLETGVRAAELLGEAGIDTRVVSMHTLKPLDEAEILSAAAETGAIATLEEHSLIGGLGSAVAEVLAEASGPRGRLKRLGVPSTFASEVGSQDYLRAMYGLSPAGVFQSLKSWL
jgi:transketolase